MEHLMSVYQNKGPSPPIAGIDEHDEYDELDESPGYAEYSHGGNRTSDGNDDCGGKHDVDDADMDALFEAAGKYSVLDEFVEAAKNSGNTKRETKEDTARTAAQTQTQTQAKSQNKNKSSDPNKSDNTHDAKARTDTQSPLPGRRAPPSSLSSSSSLPVAQILAQVSSLIVQRADKQREAVLSRGLGKHMAESHQRMAEAAKRNDTPQRKRPAPDEEDDEDEGDDDFDPLGDVPILDIKAQFAQPWAEMEAEAAKRVEAFSKAIISQACQLAHDVSTAFYNEFKRAREDMRAGATSIKDEEKKQVEAVQRFQEYSKIMQAAREKMEAML